MDYIFVALYVYFNRLNVIGPKATKFGEIICKIPAITPFKVIQGHRFWFATDGKPRFPKLVITTNLHPISYRLQVLQIIGQICAFDRGGGTCLYHTHTQSISNLQTQDQIKLASRNYKHRPIARC